MTIYWGLIVASVVILAVFILTALYEKLRYPTDLTELILPTCLVVGWGCVIGSAVTYWIGV